MPDNDPDRESKVREHAYHLWEQAGQPEGQSDAFWHQAEADLRAATHDEQALDRTIEESFPASDPPAHSGIT